MTCCSQQTFYKRLRPDVFELARRCRKSLISEYELRFKLDEDMRDLGLSTPSPGFEPGTCRLLSLGLSWVNSRPLEPD